MTAVELVMKTRILALLCFMPGLAMVGRGQTPSPGKVGVIQFQSALIGTKDGQKAAAEFEASLGPKKQQLEKLQNEIRELQDKLQSGGNTLSEATRNDLARAIDQKTKNYNRDMQDAEEDAQQERQKLFDQLSQKMLPVIDKFAQSEGFIAILDVGNANTPVLWAAQSADITKTIIELYDKTSGELPAPDPANPSRTGAAAPRPVPAPPKTAPAEKKQPGQ
jgi:outer membrane protein